MKLYDYQLRVKDIIQSGRSLVLQAPTGTGKTRAALAPFIESVVDVPVDAFPHKCLYVVPMRVLANQFYAEFRELADSVAHGRHKKMDVRIQTGEYPEDPLFEGDLIFCTVDQFLSAYLTMPYGLPFKLANIAAGALIGSYIIFDEFHLLEPTSTLPTVMHAVKQLCPIAPVMLMTATFSASLIDGLAADIGAQKLVIDNSEIAKINARSEKPVRQRVWRFSDAPLTADAVLTKHRNRTLVICNTVARAREMWRALVVGNQSGAIEIILLTSQFLKEDRAKTEERLRTLFGPDTDRKTGSYIVVATQTVEVGVDISAETLHTELAPASSLIQRAGRCARYPGESGEVIVYPVANSMPYARDKLWKEEMNQAREWLQQHDGDVFDFELEQAFVDAVAKHRDERVLENLRSGAATRKTAVERVLLGDRENAANVLIRDVDSCLVVIHDQPDHLLEDPYRAIGFNLRRQTLVGLVKDWLNRPGVDLDWRIKTLIEHVDDGNDESEKLYGWRTLHHEEQVASARILAVHPALAGYTCVEGFIPDCGGKEFRSFLEPVPDAKLTAYKPYVLESYEEHIRLVLKGLREKALPEIAYAAHALDRVAGWSSGSVTRAVWLACLLHDVGKLTVGWQEWARLYQDRINHPLPKGFAAAHTTYDRRDLLHVTAKKSVPMKRPPHACEGALSVASIVTKQLGGNMSLAQAVITAIARHHTPLANECKAFQLRADAADQIVKTIPYVEKAVLQTVDTCGLSTSGKNAGQFAKLMTLPDDAHGWLAYLLIVRALRRSDQAGTAEGLM